MRSTGQACKVSIDLHSSMELELGNQEKDVKQLDDSPQIRDRKTGKGFPLDFQACQEEAHMLLKKDEEGME